MLIDTSVYCQQGPKTIEPKALGPLSGLSFVFKDLFDVKGFVTGAGNPAWQETHQVAIATSPVVNALLSFGAKCVGRVQTDELAYSLNGQNKHYGTPINPAAKDCIPGGSSSGSAVAVARKDCDFSIGTDTGGSVRVPASYCSLYGLRPTLNALDLSYSFELAKSFDTAGIFARKLSVMEQVWQCVSSYQPASHKPAAVSYKKMYLDNQLASVLSRERRDRINEVLRASKIKLVEGDFFAENGWTLEALSHLFRTIQGYEIIQQHGQWLAQHQASLDKEIALRVEWAKAMTSEQYDHAKSLQETFCQTVLSHIKAHECCWLIPTTPTGPPRLDSTQDYLARYRSILMGLTSIAGLSGLPQLHLPLKDLTEGPCGFSLMGLPHQESVLINTAKALSV
ncbi:amidase family protein [Vibrio sp. FNV 38]|nr:amidase family protein [Vibrio sp. FNV 38]